MLLRTFVATIALAAAVACSGPNLDQLDAAFPATFDPARDPSTDLAQAVAVAKETNRRIILDVGGEWCVWCHILDKYVADHEDIRNDIRHHFVWLKVNFSPDNENKTFLSKYPEISGYPHLFVLDTDGTLMHSQGTAELEEGRSYDYAKVREFLKKWQKG